MTEETPRPKYGIDDFVDELVVALVNTRIYWSDHPRVTASITELTRIQSALLGESRSESLEIYVADDQLVYDRRPLIGASLSAPRLIQAMTNRACGGLRFHAEATEQDFQAVLQMLVDGRDSDELTGADSVNAALAQRNSLGIEFLPASGWCEISESSSAGRISRKAHQSMVETLQEATVSVSHGGYIRFDESQACIERILRHLSAVGPASILSASRYEQYDAYTFGHCVRVTILALTFARTLTDDEGLLNRIGVAAMLHDVGKVRVPFEILHCKGRLDEEQRRELEKHPEYGAEILMDHDACDPMAWSAAFGHHLNPNGGGYPKTLHDPAVSTVTSIVKLCDVFEALTAERPYKPSMEPTRAFRIMIGMGDAFDRRLLRKFIRAIGIYPSGTRVLLSTGERAVVASQTADLFLPRVSIETTREGLELDPESRIERDLSEALKSGSGCASCVIEEVFPNVDYVGMAQGSSVEMPQEG